MSYDVAIKDLRDSAKAARSAATQIGKVSPGDALTGAKAAIPGASSVSALQRVSSGWTTELADWARAAKAYGENLDTNATQYELDDAAAREAFAPAGKKNG
ncbi:hypothetical protein ACOCJ7_19185 [Knoellia sp. CPCC 206453]|uniref:hypothetical protein n=1 Tax=Knoellia pratensis TaxID=3404796 RepID=UPI003605C99F